ncbi:MAG: rRNA maturation RNase YbeY [Candidatus Buchananbacteria bacterium]
MINFDLTNETKFRPNVSLIKKIIQNFSQASRIKTAEFSLVLVKPSTIKKWNRLYRGRDQVTDVLSFAEAEAEFIEEKNNLGEILICASRAQEQAREYGWSLNQEIARLLAHGLAHLIGYEHERVSVATRLKMEKFEEQILDK